MNHTRLPMAAGMKQGFTLVETLVAITVLVIAIAGPLYAVHKSILASYVARDKLIANSLAQEGAEYVRAIRDTNYLSSAGSWLYRFDGSGGSTNCTTNDCSVGPSEGGSGVNMVGTITACAENGCASTPLKFSATNIRYVQTEAGSGATRFSRSVRVACSSMPCSSAANATVTVTVTWMTLRTTYTLTVTEQLHNWL